MSAMFPDEIADYLKNNPSFFEQYADLMSQIDTEAGNMLAVFG